MNLVLKTAVFLIADSRPCVDGICIPTKRLKFKHYREDGCPVLWRHARWMGAVGHCMKENGEPDFWFDDDGDSVLARIRFVEDGLGPWLSEMTAKGRIAASINFLKDAPDDYLN